MNLKFIIIFTATMLLTACGKSSDHTSSIPVINQQAQGQVQSQPVPAQQTPAQAPIVVQQESSSVMPALLGAAAGYMLGSAGSNRQPERQVETRVIERKVYVPAPAPAVVPKPAAPVAPAYTAPKAPVIAQVPKPTPSYSSGGYASQRQSAPVYKSTPSYSSPSRSSRK